MSRVVLRAATCSLAVVLTLLIAFGGVSLATVLTPVPALDQQGQGLSLAEAGVGLEGLGSGSETITIAIGGPVKSATLYWAGRELSDCSQGACFELPNAAPFGDQELEFDGNPLVGSIVGREDDINSNIGYKADVTNIVKAKGVGVSSFTIEDGDTANNLDRLNGAGLLVLYTDPSSSSFFGIQVFEGLDFAFGIDIGFPFADNLVTTPVLFNYDPQGTSRTGQLVIFSGDATADRPDIIEISDNASIPGALDSSDGAEWDTDAFAVNVPAGVSSTSVQLISPPNQRNPDSDSLLWVVAALRIPIARPGDGCTPGYWKSHTSSWGPTGFSPGQTLESVFDVPDSLGMDNVSLLTALDGGGGPGVVGAAKILRGAAVASVLNAAHPSLDFALTTAQVINQVNAAFASLNRDTMLLTAAELDSLNNAGCPLN